MKYLMLPRLYDRSCYLPILIINNDWYKAVVDLESQITNMSQFLRIVFFLDVTHPEAVLWKIYH